MSDTYDATPQEQIENEPTEGTSVPYSPNIPDRTDPEKAWEFYVLDAIHALYPHMRDDIDFAIGRRELGGQIELLDQSDLFAPIDFGRVQEHARMLAERDPYARYEPKPPLHAGSQLGPGEQPKDGGEQVDYPTR